MAEELITLTAGVQYDDLRGTVAADEENLFILHLREQGLVADNEFLIALNVYASGLEVDGSKNLDIYAYVLEGHGRDSLDPQLEKNPIEARKVEYTMTPEAFFAQFKRFSMVLTPPALNLDGREIRG